MRDGVGVVHRPVRALVDRPVRALVSRGSRETLLSYPLEKGTASLRDDDVVLGEADASLGDDVG